MGQSPDGEVRGVMEVLWELVKVGQGVDFKIRANWVEGYEYTRHRTLSVI